MVTLNVPDLLHSLTVAGMSLAVDDGELKVRGEVQSLTPSQRDALIANKPTLLAMLQPPDDDRVFREAMAYFDELAAEMATHANVAERLFLSPAPMVKPCGRCGGDRCYLAMIHGGKSLRRDCAACGHFIDFPAWYDRQAVTEIQNACVEVGSQPHCEIVNEQVGGQSHAS